MDVIGFERMVHDRIGICLLGPRRSLGRARVAGIDAIGPDRFPSDWARARVISSISAIRRVSAANKFRRCVVPLRGRPTMMIGVLISML